MLVVHVERMMRRWMRVAVDEVRPALGAASRQAERFDSGVFAQSGAAQTDSLPIEHRQDRRACSQRQARRAVRIAHALDLLARR